ncbi:MAG: hypothetical protein NTZ05_22140, partial [Chloroflexi bacterium]|nr:hypothetical protein [Chloroflexota bacterium]
MSSDALEGHLTRSAMVRRTASGVLAVGLLAASLIAHLRASGDWTLTGVVLPLDRLFDLSFTAAFLLPAFGLGLRLLRVVRPPELDGGERTVFAAVLGLGAIAYGVLALGLL